jgi:hypothetical protein
MELLNTLGLVYIILSTCILFFLFFVLIEDGLEFTEWLSYGLFWPIYLIKYILKALWKAIKF